MEGQKKTEGKPRFSHAWKALTIVISLLIIYTVYHISTGLTESVKTTPAGIVEQSTSVILEGVIFRYEEPIITSNKGDMRPYLYDGERASVDSVVGAIYSKGGNSDANQRIEELEEQLDILKKSNVRGLVSIVDIENLRQEINQLYTSIMLAISDGDNYKATRAQKELLICLNTMKIYEGTVDNYNSEIERIERELEELYASFEGEQELIWADKGGYFYHSCDGYENELTDEYLNSLTVGSIKELVGDVKKTPVKKSDYKCKFVYDSEWKIATYCNNATAALLEEGEAYEVIVFDIKEIKLTFTLEKIGGSDSESTLLIFSCTTMPEDFDYTRYQSFRLDISSIEGYRVPKEALQTIIDRETGEEKVGVYTLNASVVEFKRVEIISESEGYYIVAKYDRSKENYFEFLNLNDLIILDTDGIYEGKILTK